MFYALAAFCFLISYFSFKQAKLGRDILLGEQPRDKLEMWKHPGEMGVEKFFTVMFGFFGLFFVYINFADQLNVYFTS